MTLHPQHIGWCNRLQLLDDFLFYLRGFPGLWNPTGPNAPAIGWRLIRQAPICASNRAFGRITPEASAERTGRRLQSGGQARAASRIHRQSSVIVRVSVGRRRVIGLRGKIDRSRRVIAAAIIYAGAGGGHRLAGRTTQSPRRRSYHRGCPFRIAAPTPGLLHEPLSASSSGECRHCPRDHHASADLLRTADTRHRNSPFALAGSTFWRFAACPP